MASTYLGSSINESPVMALQAGEKLENARCIALAMNGMAVVKPAAGALVLGISLVETDETVDLGDDVDIQIKDICRWTAGEALVAGTELAADANGMAVAAKAGDFIVGIALSGANEAGTWVKVQITKSGYKPAA